MIRLTEILNELEIPPNKWVTLDLKTIDNEGIEEIWDMYKTTYIIRH